MISKVNQTIASPAAAPSASPKSQKDGTSFSEMLAGNSSEPAAKTTGTSTPSLLALFAAGGAKTTAKPAATAATATPQTSAAKTTATTKAASTEATTGVTNVAADAGGFIDFSPQAHETRMNSWLIGALNRENQQKMEIYQQAMTDWAVNEKQRQYLGLASQPPPAAPQLARVEAKPAGWWFSSETSV